MHVLAHIHRHPRILAVIFQAALEESLKDAESKGISTNVGAAEIDRQAEEAEEADLRMALALSLQVPIRSDPNSSHASSETLLLA